MRERNEMLKGREEDGDVDVDISRDPVFILGRFIPRQCSY